MNQRIVSAIAEVMDVVNGGREREIAESTVATFRTSHRTLQQSFMRMVIIPILVHLASNYEKGVYDERNRASCKLAHDLLKDNSDEGDLYLPYV